MIKTVRLMAHGVIIQAFLIITCMFCGPFGCGGKTQDHATLLRIGTTIRISEREFERAFELAMIAYPFKLRQDKEAFANVRWRFLNQLAEEGLILARAESLNIIVEPAALSAAIDNIKADYPDQQFEQVLAENAVPYRDWEANLARKLLIEKVIRRELGTEVHITPIIISGETPTTTIDGAGIAPKAPADNLMEKAQSRYQKWICQLRHNYPVEINWELWKKVAHR